MALAPNDAYPCVCASGLALLLDLLKETVIASLQGPQILPPAASPTPGNLVPPLRILAAIDRPTLVAKRPPLPDLCYPPARTNPASIFLGASASSRVSMASASTSTSAGTGLVLPSRPKQPYLSVACPYPQCGTQLEYLPPTASQVSNLPSTDKTFKVTCFSCKGRFEPPNSARLLREARGSTAADEKRAAAPKRRIGTDQRPLDLE